MGTTRKQITSHRCPKCFNRLLYDGKGFSCLECSHVVRDPDSSKLIMLPLKESKEKRKPEA